MLVRGSGADTVVLTGHYDTVTVADYGDLQALATRPDALGLALAERLAARPGKARWAVVNAGIGGNRLLRTGSGPSAPWTAGVGQPSSGYVSLFLRARPRVRLRGRP